MNLFLAALTFAILPAKAEFSATAALATAKAGAAAVATPAHGVVDEEPVPAEVIKTLPQEVQTSLLNAYARLMQAHYKAGAYAQGQAVVERVLEIDPQNGHALYYCGELERASTGGKSQGHRCFELYLAVEQTRPELRAGPDAARCYDNGHGYCEQRTGWICHKMANDFYKSGAAANDAAALEKAADKVLCTRARYPNGFNGKDQGTPTAELERLIPAAIKAATAP